MAGLIFVGQTRQEALTTSVTTLLQVVAPTNHRVKVLGWGVSFNDVNRLILATPADTDSVEPAQCVLTNGTVAGTMNNILGANGTYGSAVIINGYNTTIQSTVESVASGEPIKTGVFDSKFVDQTSGFETFFQKGQEPIVNGGSFVGIEITASIAVNCRVKIICEE